MNVCIFLIYINVIQKKNDYNYWLEFWIVILILNIPKKDLEGFFNTMNILDQVIDGVVNLDGK